MAVICVASRFILVENVKTKIVSPGEYTEPLKNALLEESKNKYKDSLQFCFCEHIEEALYSTGMNQDATPDYIAIVIDPKIRTSLETAEDNISKIDPVYMQGGKICLVNGSCSVKPVEMGVQLGSINVFAQRYSFILINGDVLIPENCQNLASRILVLATSVCGFFTGIPTNLDIPGYEQG